MTTNRKFLSTILFLPGILCINLTYGESATIEEVIVTATKRAQSISDVAGSISAITANEIEDRSITGIEDIQGMIPNLNFRTYFGQYMVAIRGIGGNIEANFFENGVATHVDGVYMPRSDMLLLDFDDLERIEVLRGPQGTLYGKNATGGTINFISKKPTEEHEGRISVGGGDFGAKRASAMISGPVSDSVRGRLSAFYSDGDGYFENILTGDDLGGIEKKGIRGSLAADINDNWTAYLSLFYQETDMVGPVNQDFAQDTAALPGLVELFFGSTYITSDEWYEAANIDNPEGKTETSAATFKITGELTDAITLTSTTGYIDHSNEQSFSNSGAMTGGLFAPGMTNQFVSIYFSTPSEMFSQELIFSGWTSRTEWLIGAYYFQEDYDGLTQFTFSDPNFAALAGADLVAAGFPPGTAYQGGILDLVEDNSNTALFFDVTWSFRESWRLNIGGRWSSEEKDTRFNQTDIAVLPGGIELPLASCVDQSIVLDDTDFSPKVRLERDFGTNGLGYIQYQEGSKSGQVNQSCNDTADAEQISSWEFGFKTVFADGRGTLSTAVFMYDYEEFQSIEFPPPGTSSFIVNVPEAEVLGAEIELQYTASDNLAFDFALTWLDSEITKGSTETGFDTFTLQTYDVEGNPLPSTPEYTFRAGVDYQIDFDNVSLTTRAEYFYSDEQSYRLFGIQELHPEDGGDSYSLVNLYATLSASSDRYQLRGFLRNATDEEYKNWTLYTQTGGFVGAISAPRHYGIDFVINF